MGVNLSVPQANAVSISARTPVAAWLVERKWLVLAFTSLMLMTLVLRLTTYERYLPYVDNPDEMVHFHLAQHARQLPNAAFLPDRYAPPTFYGTFNAGVQILLETLNPRPWIVMSDYIRPLRLISAIAGVLTVAVIVTLGWQLGGALAGWSAGAIWAAAPIIVTNNSFAIPDPFLYLFLAITFSSALRAWRTASPRWLLCSLIFGILTIYAKFWIATAVIPFLVVTAILMRRQPRKMLPWLVVYGLIAGISAWHLMTVVRPLDLPQESFEVDRFRSNALEWSLSPDRNFNNFWWSVYPIGHLVFYVTLASGALAYVYNVRRGKRTVWLNKIRHALPVTVVLTAVWGAALAQVTWVLVDWARRPAAKSWMRYLPTVPVLLVFGLLAPGYLVENVKAIQDFRLPEVTEVLWRYTDVNVPNDGLILVDRGSFTEKTWNRPWSGYDGVKTFEWWFDPADTVISADPADYVQRGILYFSMSDADRTWAYRNKDIDSFLSKLTLIKHIPASPNMIGKGVWFYRLIPPQVSADADFGGQIKLVGYDLGAVRLNGGDALTLRPYWRVDQRPDTNYSMFIHLYPKNEEKIVAQFDGAPTTPARLTLTWDDPDELLIGPDVSLPLPADLAPGDYRLVTGLYDFNTGARLSLPDGETYFTIPLKIGE